MMMMMTTIIISSHRDRRIAFRSAVGEKKIVIFFNNINVLLYTHIRLYIVYVSMLEALHVW